MTIGELKIQLDALSQDYEAQEKKYLDMLEKVKNHENEKKIVLQETADERDKVFIYIYIGR